MSEYAKSNTRNFFDKARQASPLLPSDFDAGDNLVMIGICQKREMRPKLWPVVHHVWQLIRTWRKTEPATAGIRIKNDPSELNSLRDIAGSGKFGFCLWLGTFMVQTLKIAFQCARTDPAWTEKISELDSLIQEMMWSIALKHAENTGQHIAAQEAIRLRREGRAINSILGTEHSLENLIVDEVETAFRLISGLVFVGLTKKQQVDLELSRQLLIGSIPLIVDWANQSLGGFDAIRAAQQFFTPKTVKRYGNLALANENCYQITWTVGHLPYFEFTDRFISTHQLPICKQIEEVTPYRISCGGLGADSQGVRPVHDCVVWMAEILEALRDNYTLLKDDF